MEEEIKKTLKSLEARNIKGWFTNNSEEARDLMLNLISRDATVGVGDSSTVRQIGIIKSLKNRGTRAVGIIHQSDLDKPVKGTRNYVEFLFRSTIEATLCDVFLTSVNAITQDGRLLSIDLAGNRVAGMFWGHPQVILTVGKNKIVKDLNEAFQRVKNVIVREHVRSRKDKGPPCVVTGTCQDCIGKNRVCNITTIIEGKPTFTEMNVIIVNEDLGLSWDESWAQKRINQIAANNEKFTLTIPGEAVKAEDKEALWKKVKPLLRSKLSEV